MGRLDDKVAVITFRADQARLLLPPTASALRCRASTAGPSVAAISPPSWLNALT